MESSPCKTMSPPPLTVRGTHQFEIVGYSLIRGLAAGQWVRSVTFSVRGFKWSVRFYPGGFAAPHRAFVSAFVKLMTSDARVWAHHELRLVDRATRLSRSVLPAHQPVVFHNSWTLPSSKCKDKRGARAFMARTELEASAYLRDDGLTIECVLDVVADGRVSEATALCQARLPSPHLSQHLGELLLNQNQDDQADITLDVQGEVFHAHKVILAMRSPVLKALLSSPMKEKETRRVVVGDMEPAVFPALLRFIYTDVVLLPGDLAGGGHEYKDMVRQAADRYGMERLKLICESILYRTLDGSTVAATLALADQHYCKALENVCVQFMSLDQYE